MKYKTYEEWCKAVNALPSRIGLKPSDEQFSDEYYDREFYKVWNLGKKRWQRRKHQIPPVMHKWRITYMAIPNNPKWYSFAFDKHFGIRFGHHWNWIICRIIGHSNYISPFDGKCTSCSSIIKGAKVLTKEQKKAMFTRDDLALDLTKDYFDEGFITHPVIFPKDFTDEGS